MQEDWIKEEQMTLKRSGFLIHICPTDTFFNETGSLLLDRLDLEMETDEREDQALEILDQVVETPTKKAWKNNKPSRFN
jgi:hypothetical protein